MISQISYWKVFRLIFVIFSLYLMKDAFYRWDGFRYYASFLEFLPNIALVTILWTIVAAFTAILVWLPLRVFQWFGLRMRWEINTGHLLMFTIFVGLLGVITWSGKRRFWPYAETTVQIKLLVFLGVALAAVFLTWLFRNKSERWMGIIQERITPLVWLFGVLVILFVPLLTYHTWGKQTDNVISQKLTSPSVADKNRPNIILITFDTLTARDMSVYGYHRPTTPFISKWAKTASLFTRLQAESNATTQTTASLMTGKRLWTHQTYHIRGSRPIRSDIQSLPLLLKNNGYYNMAFIANDAASVEILGVSNSFEVAPLVSEFSTSVSLRENVRVKLYRTFGDKIRLYNWLITKDFFPSRFLDKISQDFSETRFPAERAFNKFLSVFDNNPPEPFFAWIHLFPPHSYYLPPEPYMGIFDSSSELRTFKSQKIEMGRISEYQYFTPGVQPAVNTFRARYDEFIRYCDKQFEDFIRQLIKRNRLKKTVIILSSDHGESFEHDYLTHGGPHLYEQVTHIPLIIKGPNQTEGRIIDDIVEQIDIPATILDLAGIPVPSWMEGRSLVPLMKGKKLPSRPLFSMNFEKNPSRWNLITRGAIAVWEGDYKLIYYLEKKKSLLFNLKDDPNELNNLVDKKSEVAERLLGYIKKNLRKSNKRIMGKGGFKGENNHKEGSLI